MSQSQGSAIERESARGPDVDKIGHETEARGIVDPPVREPGDRKKDGVNGAQHEARIEQRGRNCAADGWRDQGGCGCGHAKIPSCDKARVLQQ